MSAAPVPAEPPEPVEPVLLTRAEAARAMRIGITKFKELVDDGTIAHVRIGRRVLIEPAALDDYVDVLRAEQNGNGNRRTKPPPRPDAKRRPRRRGRLDSTTDDDRPTPDRKGRSGGA